jgi:RNA polymerase sigma-70 factor (ECF subfamily)
MVPVGRVSRRFLAHVRWGQVQCFPMSPMSQSSAGEPQPRETSLSLLARANSNEAESWRRLVNLYSPLVFFWCRRAGLNREDAADILQNVWQAVAGHLSQFVRQRDGAFRSWLWTITRNKLNDHFRRLHNQPQAAGGSTAQQFWQEVPEQEPESYVAESALDGSGDILRRALELIRGDFEPHTWQAFWLAAIEDQPAKAIAERLQMSLDAVYQAKARIMRRLREELAGLQDEVFS